MGASAEYKRKALAGDLSGEELTVRVISYEGVDDKDPRKATLVGRVAADASGLSLEEGVVVEVTLEDFADECNRLIKDLATDGEPMRAQPGSIVTFFNCEVINDRVVSASGFTVREYASTADVAAPNPRF